MDKGTGIFTQNTKRKSMILKHARKIPKQPGQDIARLTWPPMPGKPRPYSVFKIAVIFLTEQINAD